MALPPLQMRKLSDYGQLCAKELKLVKDVKSIVRIGPGKYECPKGYRQCVPDNDYYPKSYAAYDYCYILNREEECPINEVKIVVNNDRRLSDEDSTFDNDQVLLLLKKTVEKMRRGIPEDKESATSANTTEIVTPKVNATTANTTLIAAPKVNATSANTTSIAAPKVNATTTNTTEIATPKVNATSTNTTEIVTPKVNATSAVKKPNPLTMNHTTPSKGTV